MVRRRRCRGCGRTGGVLPSGVLYRRLDPVEVVGRIVDASIRGEPAGEIAAGTCVPARTVRDILARYQAHAPVLARDLLALTVALGGHFSFAVEIPVQPDRRAAFALGAAWARARRRGAQAVTPWHWLADISGRRVLGTNTSLPRTGPHAHPELTGGPAGRPNPGRLPRAGAARCPAGRAPPPLSACRSRSARTRLH
jgi:(2Fe-2S) ferredoxin